MLSRQASSLAPSHRRPGRRNADCVAVQVATAAPSRGRRRDNTGAPRARCMRQQTARAGETLDGCASKGVDTGCLQLRKSHSHRDLHATYLCTATGAEQQDLTPPPSANIFLTERFIPIKESIALALANIAPSNTPSTEPTTQWTGSHMTPRTRSSSASAAGPALRLAEPLLRDTSAESLLTALLAKHSGPMSLMPTPFHCVRLMS